jgi:tetratricopeptide (TPR) repeat protein
MRQASLQHRYLDLSRVLFRAARFSGDSALESATVRLTGDLIRLTEDYYHGRQYERSIECGKVAVAERPETITGRSYLIRSLIQQEDWAAAEAELKELTRFAPPRDVYFLRGFLERRRGEYRRAIEAFEEALRRGRRGAAIYRELSVSYFLVGELEPANAHLQTALERHGHNRYVVDLWAQLATERGDEREARRALARLEIVDRPVFFNFRRSRVEWRFGNVAAAREASLAAVAAEERPPFPIIAQVVLCEIANGHLDSASTFLEKLDRDYGDVRRDVRTGLHCRLEIAHGNFTEALRLTDRFIAKQSRYYRIIRYDALKGELKNASLDETTRRAYEQELEALTTQLGESPRFDIPELDAFAS